MFRRAWALRAAGGRGQARWRSDDGVTIESRIVLGSASLIPFPLGSPLSSFFFPLFFEIACFYRVSAYLKRRGKRTVKSGESFFYLFYNTASENENVGCVEVN